MRGLRFAFLCSLALWLALGAACWAGCRVIAMIGGGR